MTRRVFLAGLAGLFLAVGQVSANEMEPKVRVMHAGAARLIQDMEAVLSLTSPVEQEQTRKIRDYLELSFIGMSFDRLMRLDILFGGGPHRYRIAFPLEDERELWAKNLIPNGIQKKRRYSNTLYSTQGSYEGFLRIRDAYAIFATKREELPATGPAPDEEVAHLRKLTDSAALELINDPEGVEYRRKSYNADDGDEVPDGLRDELSDKFKKTRTKSESQESFDLRELLFEHQLDEIERLYVEAARLLLVSHFDLAKKTLSADFQLKAIPNTALAKSVQSLNQAPLSFANVPQSPRSNMSLRVRFPLDEMRRQNLTETLEMLRKIAHKEADENKNKTAGQQDAADEVIDLSFQLLLDNVKGGLADGFFESHSNPDGTSTAIGAFKAENGNAPIEILKLLEKTRADQKVELNLDKEGGVAFHSFLVSEDQHPGFRNFFGGFKVYVGTSDDAIWLGAGPNVLEEMKTAIREVAKPNQGQASDPFFTVSGRIAPWLELHQKSYPDAGSNAFRDYRRMMIEAGQPGDDRFQGWLNREGDTVVGKWSAQPGWARFLGKYLADFAKENL